MITKRHLQAIDFAEIVAKRAKIPLFEAFPEASAKFEIPEEELKSRYEIHQLELKLTQQAARVKKYQNISK